MRVYLDFYNFKKVPFSITPDPEFLFLSNSHQNVIDKIVYGIKNRMGFILLVGEVGTGKTTICRAILDILDDDSEMVYIINPSLSGTELISSILDDLGINYPPDSSKKDLIDHLNHFLLSVAATRPVVIIIDDAQTMPIDALEDLRLLSNLETDKEKLLQMVLVGQPELVDLISRPEMRQLRQRVAISCRLDYLTREEVEGYISRRLFVAGSKGHVRFTPRAVKQIYNASRGIPRLINRICDYALIAAYIANDFTIGPSYVKKALKELEDLEFEVGVASIGKDGKTRVADRKLSLVLAFSLIFLLLVFLVNHLFDLPLLRNEKDTDLSRYSNRATVLVRKRISPQRVNDSIYKEADGIRDSSVSAYTLRVGSFKTLDRLRKAISIYRKRGFEVHWNRVDLGPKGKWYRLFTGSFKTKEEAELFKRDYGLVGSIVVSAPWTVLVSQSGSPKELDQLVSVLRDNMFDPYIVKSRDGTYRLLVGTFVTYEGAETLAQKINKIGLTARAVRQ